MCDTLQVSALRACKQHLHCTVEPHPATENVARPPLRILIPAANYEKEGADWVPFFGVFAFEVYLDPGRRAGWPLGRLLSSHQSALPVRDVGAGGCSRRGTRALMFDVS